MKSTRILRMALVTLMIGGMAAWSQAPKDTTAGAEKTEKVNKAAAYYHFMLACMYADMAPAAGNRNSEYADKASENLKAAIAADPQAPTQVPMKPLGGISYRPIPAMQPAPPASKR